MGACDLNEIVCTLKHRFIRIASGKFVMLTRVFVTYIALIRSIRMISIRLSTNPTEIVNLIPNSGLNR